MVDYSAEQSRDYAEGDGDGETGYCKEKVGGGGRGKDNKEKKGNKRVV